MTAGPRPEARPVASVVIPAHDEEAVIGRLLQALGDARDRLEVIVACNGCTDATASIARQHGAHVVEVSAASKIAALNAADHAAATFPRVYVDADVILTGRAVLAMAEALADPGVLCAAPPLIVDVADRPLAVRAYYAVWCRIPYLRDSHVGSGVYAMSAAGRARFDRFPDVIADDLLGRNLFTRSERAVVATDPFVVQAPRTLRALVRRRIRIDAGNLELAARTDLPALPGAGERVDPWWRAVTGRPWLAPAAVCYAAVNLVARLAARRLTARNGSIDWRRDDTTRGALPAETAGART
jgi:glycosyltransferase involved in cell wall biosynthesis